jgi:hypothetical protein
MRVDGDRWSAMTVQQDDHGEPLGLEGADIKELMRRTGMGFQYR